MRECISTRTRLSVTLRYLATGNTFEDLKFGSAVSPQSISCIVMETCEGIIHCLKEYIKLPRTRDEWKVIAKGFEKHWNFPQCLGAIDGKHVEIKCPPNSGSMFYNYKKTYSIVLMAVVISEYEFIMTDVGVNGRVSDGGVFSHTTFGQMFKDQSLHLPELACLPNSDRQVPYVLVGDDAFALSENL